jgi:uncharacterized membrane protein YtjA (UPF0391 family)
MPSALGKKALVGRVMRQGNYERLVMLGWSLTFLIIALLAGLLGFAGIAGTAAWIAQVLFVVFLVLFLLSLVFGRRTT